MQERLLHEPSNPRPHVAVRPDQEHNRFCDRVGPSQLAVGVSRALGVTHPLSDLSRGRLRDLAFWTREELFPQRNEPADRRLLYSYAVSLQQVVKEEEFDFHPILMGMAEAWRDTGDIEDLRRGLEQIEAFAAHDEGQFDNNLHLLDTRPDCQHFMAAWLEANGY